MLLRPKHLRAIDLLAHTDLSQCEIAARLHLSRQTLTQWVKDADFRRELARRREVLPHRFESLRRRVTRRVLLEVENCLEVGGERPKVRELTQLLMRLSGETLERLSTEPPEPPEPEITLTTEQAEAIWAEREARLQAAEEAGETVRFPRF